jgi:hypothetical protein
MAQCRGRIAAEVPWVPDNYEMMLLQTNSYIVPKDKRAQHARLVQRFRQCLTRLGCDHFEAYEQVGANWSPADTTGRFVQLMRFRDRKHQLAVQAAERNDTSAQALIKEFCELINFPYQQQQGLFAVGFYHSLLPSLTPRAGTEPEDEEFEEESPLSDLELPPEPGQPPAVPTMAQPMPETQSETLDSIDDLVLSDSNEPLLGELDLDDEVSHSPLQIRPADEHGSSDDEIEAEPHR